MPHTQKPISDQRFAANRANAAKSTGPKTPEGKARSSQNAVKHGFAAAAFAAAAFAVVRLEDLQEVANLKADLVSVYQPVNSQELVALERMALAQQAIFRASRLEAGLFTTCMNETMGSENHVFTPMSQELAGDGEIEIARSQNRNYCLADGFLHQIRKSNVWSLFLRYQAQAERQYRRALEEFDRLKALRQLLSNEALPNEPIADLQPEDKPDLCPLSELDRIRSLVHDRQSDLTEAEASTTIVPSAPDPSAPDPSTPGSSAPSPVGQAFPPAKANEARQPAANLPEAASVLSPLADVPPIAEDLRPSLPDAA